MGLTIGGVARSAGVGVETVRFYERRGLLEQPGRRRSGYRDYPDSAVVRIHFIRRAQELGFTLREIGELIALEEDATATCDVVRDRASSKIESIEDKIRDLQNMKAALGRLMDACAGNQLIRDCAIISCLQDTASESI